MQILRALALLLGAGLAEIALADTYLTAARLLDTERGRLLESPAVIVTGNPLEDITVTESVSFVMKDGVVYKSP